MTATAMVLAAGEGRRLRPLTDTLPKPLLPVGGQPLLAMTLAWLDRLGFRRIVVNAHHHADRLVDFVETLRPRIAAELIVSVERELLGTGGGIRLAARHWTDDGAWIVNGDVVCDVALAPDKPPPAPAVMLLRASPDALRLGPIYTDGHSGRVVGMLDAGRTEGTPLMFTGIHYLSRALAETLPERGCVVRDGYIPWLTGRLRPVGGPAPDVAARVHHGYWNEIGTPEAYAAVDADRRAGKLTWL